MMLEGDDRSERGDVGRLAQDLGALDRVALHDREFSIGQLVGLVQHFERRPHLADVVHQRSESEFAQQRSVDAKAASLTHREDRHVHHVRERVVVVVLERGQREQRGSVLRDRLREPIDHRSRHRRVRLILGLCAVPQVARDPDRIVVEPFDGRHVGEAALDALLDGDAADADVRQCRERQLGIRLAAFRRGNRLDELAELLERHAAIDRDSLDAGRPAGAASAARACPSWPPACRRRSLRRRRRR